MFRLLITLGVLGFLGVGSPAAAEPRKPNIVFILADDLGWTDLGCQGSKFYETPNIDRMATQGLRLTSAYTCGPNCQPTRAALMSGQYGPRTGVYTVGGIDRFDWQTRPLKPVDNVVKLPRDRKTVAEAIKAAGYATGLFGKWHLGEDPQHHPGQRGFDEAIVSMGQHFNFKTNPAVEIPKDAYLADFLTDKAVNFIKTNRERPFFLYLPHFGVHSPFQAKPDLKAKFEKKAAVGGHANPTYAAMIASVDDSVGRILKTLDELKLAENTLVIFSSDNGGVGGYVREGIKAGGDVTDNTPLRSGKGSLYEGGVRVPLIARWPGKIPVGTTDVPFISVDLFPTLISVAGGTPPKNQPLDGVNLLPCWKSGGKEAPPREAIYWHFPGYLGAGKETWRTTPAGAIRKGQYKLIEFFEDGRQELYDLSQDLSQKTNLLSKMPEQAKALHNDLVAWRKAVNAPMPTKNPSRKE
jgi:arylsulfatase A-like enzyme